MLRDVRIGRPPRGGFRPGPWTGIDVVVRPPDWQSVENRRHSSRVAPPTIEHEDVGVAKRLLAPVDRIVDRAERIGKAVHGPLPANYMEYASNIAFAGRHLGALIRDVREFGHADADDDPKVKVTRFDAAAAIRTVLGFLRPAASAKKIEIGFATDARRDVRADRQRFDQILTNLLGNAVKFTPEGGQAIVQIEAGEPVRIFVRDSGPGIDPDDAERIFERFERLGSAEEGTGLGLPLSRAYAEAMNGRLFVSDFETPGATFCLELPAG